MDFFTRIAEHTPQLNKNDNEILSYCIRNHAEIANLKVTELADRLFISPASVVRFCQNSVSAGIQTSRHPCAWICSSRRRPLVRPGRPTFSGYPENHSDGTRRNCGTHRGADPPQPPY